MRNNRPFLREPPYRRRETLIERLGFLFVQISSRRQSGGGQGLSVGDGCLRFHDSLYQRETPREYSTSEFKLRVPLAWSRERLEGRHPYYLRVYTPYFILTLYEYILLVIIVPYFYYTFLVYILLVSDIFFQNISS